MPRGVRPEDNPAAPKAGTELCRLDDLADPGAKGFSWREGEALFDGFIVRKGDEVFGYVDWCPHAGWPLALAPDRYLTRDGRAVLCSVHAALFDPKDGHCLAGPGVAGGLIPWPVQLGADRVVRVE